MKFKSKNDTFLSSKCILQNDHHCVEASMMWLLQCQWSKPQGYESHGIYWSCFTQLIIIPILHLPFKPYWLVQPPYLIQYLVWKTLGWCGYICTVWDQQAGKQYINPGNIPRLSFAKIIHLILGRGSVIKSIVFCGIWLLIPALNSTVVKTTVFTG